MDGQRLKQLRLDKSLTQQKLADYLEVELTTIGKWELHNVTPNKYTLAKLAELFDTTTDYLLGRDIKAQPLQPESKPLTEEETELLKIFNQLNSKYQQRLIGRAYATLDDQNEEGDLKENRINKIS